MIWAPSSNENEIKYEDWTLEELKAECNRRKLEFNSNDTKEKLINLLVDNDNAPPDWGKIYSRVLYHTGMAYEEISRRTIPQIRAILDGAEENIPIKLGFPNMFNVSTLSPTESANEPPKLSQFAAFANAFDTLNTSNFS